MIRERKDIKDEDIERLSNILEKVFKEIPNRVIVYDTQIDTLTKIDGIKVNGQLRVGKVLYDILCPWPNELDVERLKSNFDRIVILDLDSVNEEQEYLPVYKEEECQFLQNLFRGNKL